MLRNVGNDPKINVRWLEGCSEFATRRCQFLVFEPLGLFANTITFFVWLNLPVVWSPSYLPHNPQFLRSVASTQYVRFSLRSINVAGRLRMSHEVKKCGLFIQHTKFRKFRLIHKMKRTISVWSDRKYRSFVSCLQEQ